MTATLILLPGLGGDASLWAAQVTALAPHLPVHASEAHFDAVSIPAMASAVLAETTGPLIVCGTSMGGFIALEMVRQAQERITGLALLSTTAHADPPEVAAFRRNTIAAIERDGLDAFIEKGWQRAVHASRHEDKALAERILRANRRVGQARYIRQLQAIIERPQAEDSAAMVACPTIILHGHEDALIPGTSAEHLAHCIPNARLEFLTECGHMPNIEHPTHITRELRNLARQSMD